MCRSNHCEPPTLILASGSPRRRDLVGLLGLPFVVQPADVVEENHIGEDAAAMVMRLSQSKARATLPRLQAGLVVGADTTVWLDGQVLGKPESPAHAAAMLGRLRGRPHTVFSGITLFDAQSGWMRSELAESQVHMRNYSDDEIAAYVASGDPLDKAGSYAIQYADFRPVERIVGCYANVMGLPLCHLYCMLRERDLAPAVTPVDACNCFNRRVCDVAERILSLTRA
jgi:septum formation protein